MGRRGAAPLRIPLDDQTLRCRHQFEFWLAPPGEHTMSLPWKYWLAPTAENIPMPLHMCCRSITPHLVLIIKYGVHPPGGFSDQKPECEVWLNAFNTPVADEQSA